MTDAEPNYAHLYGILGASSAMIFSAIGAGIGTIKAGTGIAEMSVRKQLTWRALIPVVMSGVIGIYGLVTAVLITGALDAAEYTHFQGFAHFGAGLTVGLSCLISGYAIGVVGDAGVRATAEQPELFVRTTLIMIFAETLGLYGFMIGIIMYTKK